jgi:hypothetical protein
MHARTHARTIKISVIIKQQQKGIIETRALGPPPRVCTCHFFLSFLSFGRSSAGGSRVVYVVCAWGHIIRLTSFY